MKIKILRSNNGTEYMSKNMTQYLAFHGILLQSSCVGTPQQNGVVERKNKDLLEKTKALMMYMHVPKTFWSHGVLSAAYLINRLPSRILHFKSPFEVLQKQPPNLSHLRVFGCTCFVHIQTSHRDKFDPRAAKCVFLGYSATQKGYKCYHPPSKKLFISRDVRFEESSIYFKDMNQQDNMAELFPLPNVATDLTPSADSLVATDDFSTVSGGIAINEGNISPVNTHSEHSSADSKRDGNHNKNLSTTTADIHADSRVITNFENDSANQSLQPPLQHPPIISITTDSEGDSEGDSANQSDSTNHSPLPQPHKNPTHHRAPPTKLQDSVTYAARHPMSNYLTYQHLSTEHAAFFIAISDVHEPHNFQEANSNDEWRQAMHGELQALDQNQTWSVVKLPKDKHVVGSRWCIKSSSTQMGVLTDTRRVLWLRVILKLLV
jgi:hypothetical protein